MFRLFAELGRRNLIGVAAAYASAAWGVCDTKSIVPGS